MTLVLNGTTGVSSVDGSASTPAIQGNDTNTGVFFPAADTVAIATGGTEAVRVDSSRNVGIGVTPAGQAGFRTLEVGGSGVSGLVDILSGTSVQFRLYNSSTNVNIANNTSAGAIVFNNTTVASGFGERARIDSSGNFLVGTTNTSESAGNGLKLLVGSAPGFKVVTPASSSSSASFMSYSTGASAYRFYVTDAGVINATSTSITGISDESLKENIRDLETGLAQVMALKPRRFDWKEETQIGEKNVAGFIAQEVEPVLPELVYDYKYNADETKKALKMGDILPTLVKAIQEQQALITSLTARIAALEGAAQ